MHFHEGGEAILYSGLLLFFAEQICFVPRPRTSSAKLIICHVVARVFGQIDLDHIFRLLQ